MERERGMGHTVWHKNCGDGASLGVMAAKIAVQGS